MTIAMEDIKGRLLLELYTHWCQGRFGGYQQPTPTVMRGFENYLETTILSEGPTTDPVHEAWTQYQVKEAPQPPDLVAPTPAPPPIPDESTDPGVPVRAARRPK